MGEIVCFREFSAENKQWQNGGGNEARGNATIMGTGIKSREKQKETDGSASFFTKIQSIFSWSQ
jgi:hypothetical protein